tara:strand:- start:312 stop:605 length:294 start_codon:yes stop_codon:yes gene_type:complete
MTKKDVKATEDPANKLFMDLIQEDQAVNVETVAVDSGQIGIGDCEKIQFEVDTATGDGLYPVWRGKKYIIIEIDMLNIMKLDQELKAIHKEKWPEEN